MAHVDNQISSAIRKHLDDFTESTKEEISNDFEELIQEYRDFFRRLDSNTRKIAKEVKELDFFSLQRATIIQELEKFKDLMEKMQHKLEKVQKFNETFDSAIADRFVDYKKIEFPFFDEIFESILEIPDFEIKLGGQKIMVSVGKTPNLRTRSEKIYDKIPQSDYQKRIDNLITDLLKKVDEEKAQYLKKEKLLEDEVIEDLAPTVQNLVDAISKLNIKQTLLFQEIVELVNRVLKIAIEIEEVIPDEEYDLMYARFLDAQAEDDPDFRLTLFRSLASEIFPEVDLRDMNSEDLEEFIRTNYFD